MKGAEVFFIYFYNHPLMNSKQLDF